MSEFAAAAPPGPVIVPAPSGAGTPLPSLSRRPPPGPGRGWSGDSEATEAVRDPGEEGQQGRAGGAAGCGGGGHRLSWRAAPARRGHVRLSAPAWPVAPEPRGPARVTRHRPRARCPAAARPRFPPPLPPPRLGYTDQAWLSAGRRRHQAATWLRNRRLLHPSLAVRHPLDSGPR